MICFCALAGTDACNNCGVYKQYSGESTTQYKIVSDDYVAVRTVRENDWEIPSFMNKEKQNESSKN